MPHIELSHFPVELTHAEKEALAKDLTRVVCDRLKTPSSVVSIALEPVTPEQWHDRVIAPRLLPAGSRLIKKPNYPIKE
ncbi:4-oxalocrotonate tautomerase [Chromohalobacter marismortui]|uniref:4-oxalocrotonate tautomerase n=1 Tax=Chromohalobacter marismortui TaxID=42055 RepID=A0A4R7NSN3_9GAMM|nr:4-oxalocrotonate tautomerase [Chromohalobacter marismortui]UKF74907.1 4-oxalocrotonate tautomerase [Chromohalobacter marismortui]